ncbi:Oxoglutarate and iron-dependent oxygenase degradation C-term-domain-containing protein [Lactarius hengduanensis]|nr:Oxoglutarate and iron-dependent oxygenase degradation C-term-domain-containing protein [Lactarius hengduanensis]
MVKTHPRSPSPEPEVKGMKRPKIAHESSKSHPAPPSPHDCFAPDLFDPAHVGGLAASYSTSEPFKHALVQKLFQDDLLQQVKDECLSELHFTEKETDIYKVNQTGDLASLSYLTEQQVAFLPNLIKLRDALYSQKFRNFLREVTGCGPLSGVKQDMSVNTYRKGCHLLNHDDVIGTRRVSYILYMPLPHYQLWQKEWGGALELYPVREGADGTLEPEPVPAKSIPPSWNQFIFFEVQPGRSFHSVEEVVVGEGEDGWQRLSISGWFHAAQPGEDGYEGDGETVPSVASSREQLTSTSTTEFKSYSGSETPPLPDTPLAEGHLSFLSEFLNPAYLQPRTIKALASRFMGELSLELHDFLSGPIAERLDAGLREMDARDGLGKDRPAPIPPHTAGRRAGASRARRTSGDELFPSPAFRAWLAAVSKLLILRYAVEARRFCPGLGYTLATSEEREARLDVVLSLTPTGEPSEGRGEGKNSQSGGRLASGGGWECYMAPHEEEDDPRSKAEHNGDGHAVEMEDSDDEDEDATLLTSQPGFNRLLLVLRDEGVMRFVKYVSAAAEGSRWDVCGEYEVGMIEADDSDD